MIHALTGAPLRTQAPRRLATMPAFDPAQAAVEGSVAKALTLFAIAPCDLVAAHPGPTLKHPDCPRAHARDPTKDVSVKKVRDAIECANPADKSL
jgi:hypothetical protein